MKAATLFSGGGVADIGIEEAGGDIIWGIDYHEKYGAQIAEWNSNQTGNNVLGVNILSVDPRQLPKINYLHLSPPCPSFSIANKNKGETANDIALAKKNAEFIEMMQPEIVTVENVWGYVGTKSYHILADALNKYYFMGWDVHHLDAADFGVPQNRKRLIVRAIRGRSLPPLPKPEPHQGWYQAIEDLIPGLEEGDFAPWQKERLKDTEYGFMIGNGTYSKEKGMDEPAGTVTANRNQGTMRAFLVTPNSTNLVVRNNEDPSASITADAGDGKTRAFIIGQKLDSAYIVDGTPKGKRPPSVREQDRPIYTIAAGGGGRLDRVFLISGNNSQTARARTPTEPVHTIISGKHKGVDRGYINGRIVILNTRCLARFQTIPDWYQLPEGKTLATTIIGNGFPTLWAKKIAQPLIEQFSEAAK